MENQKITIVSDGVGLEKKWRDALVQSLGEASGLYSWSLSHETPSGDWGQILFVDGEHSELDRVLHAIDRHHRSVFLILDERKQEWDWSDSLSDKVDDLVIYPFRREEIISKFRLHQHLRMWSEVGEVHRSFNELLRALDEDVQLAEKLQKARLPNRFPEVRGLKIASRFIAGLKGGDYFDLAESKDQSRISILMSDSSSFGLSSSFLSVLMQVAFRLSRDESRRPTETVQLILKELLLGLKEKDRLSLFYGVLNRKDYRLRYLHLGEMACFHARKGQSFELIPAQGPAISLLNADPNHWEERELVLEPNDRVVMISDGFIEKVGGVEALKGLLGSFRDREASDLSNELVFRLKKDLADPDDLPKQDATCLVFDLDAKLLRLA